MNIQEVELKTEYNSLTDDIANHFYIPLLSRSVLYQRAVGFFSSTSLVEISKGITGLIKNNGCIQLIVSPKLSEEDIDAIKNGYILRDKLIEDNLLEQLRPPKDYSEESRLNLLARLVYENKLEIKVALLEKGNQIGMYHEKLGIIHDDEEQFVSFSGSMNDSETAYSVNYDSFDVFCSWNNDSERAKAKKEKFEKLWENQISGLQVLDAPDAVLEKIKNYSIGEPNYNIDYEEFKKQHLIKEQVAPYLPETIELREYQLEAIDEWEKQGYRGIFDMATGTGKTITGLAAVERLSKNVDSLAIIIVCPYQHLVDQWVEDIELFGLKPIIAYSSSTQKHWKRKLKLSIDLLNFNKTNILTLVTTNATFSGDYVQSQINQINQPIVLVVDEAHNFGTDRLTKLLDDRFEYRLALSATFERHGDDDGTNKLKIFFGEKCIEYTLEMAIKNEMLSPYYYYPVLVTMDDFERKEYSKLSLEAIQACIRKSDGTLEITEKARLLLIKRARLVAGIKDKLAAIKREIAKKQDESNILVYCGATTVRDVDYEEGRPASEELRQVDAVSSIIGNDLDMKVRKFTSQENSYERSVIKKAFSNGKDLQALVAIRCLDEGVNIPSIKTAYILASSTNPKEYIQRRGRVLRKSENKDFALIYDFITLPFDDPYEFESSEISLYKSLIKKEINRIREFSSIALNEHESYELMINLSEIYGVNIFEEDDKNEYL